jgi:hypothetical protein
VAFLSLLIPHTEQHVAAMMQDPTRQEQAAATKKALQQYAAMWMTYVRQLRKALEAQAQEADQQAQPDPVQQAKIATEQAKLESIIRKTQVDQSLKVADVKNRMDIDRQKADLDMAIKINKANAEMATELPPASQSDIVSNRTMHTPSV